MMIHLLTGHIAAGCRAHRAHSYSTVFNLQPFTRYYIFMCSIAVDGASDAVTPNTAVWAVD